MFRSAAPADHDRRSQRFLRVLALANAGGVVAYLPLLTLLLPLKVEEVAADARLGLLTAISLAGAVAASLSNIAFGMLSDRAVARGGSRRGWIAAGAVLTAVSYGAVGAARTPGGLLAAIVLFQVAVNALLAPLTATMADEVPDDQKGTAGGLLAFGGPIASAISALLVGMSALNGNGRLLVIVLAFSVMLLPLLLTPARAVLAGAVTGGGRRPGRRDLVFAWTGRLLVQVPGVVLFAYLLFYFRTVAPGAPGERVAAWTSTLLACSFAASVPLALAAGVASDRFGARKLFLAAAAVATAAGLAVMAVARDWWPAAAGFALYACGSATFLGLNTAHAMQLLPSPDRRGRDLGLLNLANTAPALIGPALAWTLATATDFRTLLLVLAASALAGGVVTILIGRGPSRA
ncbi:MFS transporter [uncultured Sphingomonas sp.]|uniref:MFS transporter n=1 Tax=uncultured Sphingomonas sp. TaxID=158754 RepID=UPI0035C99250